MTLPTLKKLSYKTMPNALTKRTVWITLAQSLLWASFVSTVDAQTYTSDRSKKALTHVRPGLDMDTEDMIVMGRSFINIPWVESPAATTARDGLGPLFNANTCVACHNHNGAGSGLYTDGRVPRSSVVQLQHKTTHGWQGDPVYGPQVSINGSSDVPAEAAYRVNWQTATLDARLRQPLPEFTQLNYGPIHKQTQAQILRAPALTGLGMLEAIPSEQILAKADPQDTNQDGISGRTNMVWSPASKSQQLGRFGWKNTTSSVLDQSAQAAHFDMGLTNPLFPEENCTASQTLCLAAYKSQQHDLPGLRLLAMDIYLKNLLIPKANTSAKQKGGKALFQAIGCTNCHSNSYTTANGEMVPAYTDLLLHDMGPGLAGAGPLANEWRTAPLWGLGLNKHQSQPGYLHDGRASTINQAILWHAGEAEASQQAYNQLSTTQQQQLIDFLETL